MSLIIGNSVTTIGDEAFIGCSGLTSVVIPDSVTTIGEDAFRWCRGLTSVIIGSSVTSIGEDAFCGCDKLVEVINYSSLNITKGSSNYGDIGRYALNVKTSGTTDIVNKKGYLFYTYNNVNYLLGYSGTDINLILPESYNGQSYQIYNSAFYECSGLTSVVIGNSVTSIGDEAFSGCKLLTSVVIGNSVTSIGSSAFEYCSGLTSIVIPESVTSIGDGAFDGCRGLTSVVIPNSVTSIGSSAFEYCSGLESITVATNNKKYCSVNNCLIETASKTLILGCENSVIPTDGSVTSIGDDAFRGCSGLTSVVIGNSVTSIGDDAFYGCWSLTKVYYGGSTTDWNNITIGSYNSYLQNATRYYYSEVQPTNSGNYWHYDSNGNIVEW